MSASFQAGITTRGILIVQEDNLEPVTIKDLSNFFLQSMTNTASFRFPLAGSAVDVPVSFGTITNAKGLFVFSSTNITFKINSLGSSPIPCNPYAIILGANGGITDLYLTNLGTATDVQVWIGT